jgi:hypothetical protein
MCFFLLLFIYVQSLENELQDARVFKRKYDSLSNGMGQLLLTVGHDGVQVLLLLYIDMLSSFTLPLVLL